jgi:hypothetical protein
MTAPLHAIGRLCSRHHNPTIALWLPEQAYGSNPPAFESHGARLARLPQVDSAISPLSKEGIGRGLLSKDKTIAFAEREAAPVPADD